MVEQRRLITTDSHTVAPLTLADELPERLRGKVPHLEERSDGTYLVRPLPGIADKDGNVDNLGDAMTKNLLAGIKVDPDDDAMMSGSCMVTSRRRRTLASPSSNGSSRWSATASSARC